MTDLSGLLGDPQTPKLHASDHEDLGADEINVQSLSGKLADMQDAGWLRTQPVSVATPNINDILTYSGTTWQPQPLASITSPVILSGLTGVGLALGEAVYISASDTVTKAQADSVATMPSVGIVSKLSPLEITVVGKVMGLTGITPGATYYVSQTTPGVITTTPPTATTHVIQSVALGLNTTTVVVLPVQFTTIT